MAMKYRGGVVLLDDGSGSADDLAARVQGVFPDIHTLPPARAGDRRGPGVKALVRAMVDQQAYWALLPKGRDPVGVIADFLGAARPALAAGFPAFVLVAAAPGVRYRRIAIVVDVRSPITTGVLPLTGVGLACHLGCSLDVLLLGADSGDAPSDWQGLERLLEVRAGAEDYERALEVARERDVEINWIALGESAQRDQLVLDAVAAGGYDLVLDDLRPLDVGPPVGRRKRVRQQLQHGTTDTAYRLLRDAGCDVGLVADAVTMNLVPSSAAAVGAAAALSIGMVGAAVAPQPNRTAPATMVAAESATAPVSDAVAQVEQQPAAEAPPAEAPPAEAPAAEAPPAEAPAAEAPPPVVTTPAPAVDVLPGRIDGSQMGQIQGTFAQAQAEAAAAQAELDARAQQLAAADHAAAMAQTDLALERADVASARATAKSAEDRLKYADSGRDRLTDAEEARALGSMNAAKRDLQRQQADVEEAAASLAAASDAAAAAAQSVAQQQVVVDAQQANVAGWGSFVSEADARTPKVVSPMPGRAITTGYGVSGGRWSSGRHTGVDFAAPSGTAVVAAADGVVTSAGRNGPYGNQVSIRHADGRVTTYSHLSSIGVSTGQRVGAGERVGGVGSTGNSTGPHLHFEVIDAGGGFLNPSSWLRENGAL